MAKIEKTVYFGSFFELTSTGRDELIRDYQAICSTYNATPFIGFDSKHNLFHCKTDNDDSIALFISKFKHFLEFHTKKSADVIRSPRILPIRSTVLPEELIDQDLHNFLLSGDRLIEYNEDSDGSSEKISGPVLVDYWRPRGGDISILPNDTAAAIANLTDCFISPEPDVKRVKLISGNVQVALGKLKRLEPLLEFQALHRTGATSRIKHNIHVPTNPTSGTGTIFVSAMSPSHRDRIMVQTSLEDYLGSMLIGEQRNWDNSKGKYTKPINLSLINMDETRTTRPSRIWINHRVSSIGDAMNVEPVRSASFKVGDDTEERMKNVAQATQASKYLKAQDQARVSEWSQNVDFHANPEIAAPEPVDKEAEISPFAQTNPRDSRIHWVVAEDSDSEAKISETLANAVRRTRLVESTSDEEPTLVKQTRGYEVKDCQLPVSYTAQQPNYARMSQVERSRRAILPVFHDEKVCHPATFSDHAAFYAGIPQDDNSTADYQDQDKSASWLVLPKKTGQSEHNHAFGLDGACDPKEKSRMSVNDSSQLSPKLSTSFDSASYGTFQRRLKTKPAASLNRKDSLAKGGTSNYQIDSKTSRSNTATYAEQSTGDRNSLLIDFEEENDIRKSIQPPPGFDYRAAPFAHVSSASHILDMPIPRVDQSAASYLSTVRSTDVSEREAFEQKPASQSWKPQLTIPKRDLEYLRGQTINKLIEGQELEKREDNKAEKTKAAQSTECIAKEDESMNRAFHQTMTLQTPNPSLDKKSTSKQKDKIKLKGETKKERAERIAKAKVEAFGPASASGASYSRPSSMTSPESDTISVPVRKAMKSSSMMAALHPNTILNEYRKQQSKSLLEALQEEFEAARAFTGSIIFEVQLGQILVAENTRIKDQKVYESHQWDRLFCNKHDAVSTVFSNILTSNGADIDRLLEIRDPKSKTKIWSPVSPGPHDVLYEFSCQDRTGLNFKITIDSNGGDTVTRPLTTIGKAALHFSGQVWDACATIRGVSSWHDISSSAVDAAQHLVSGIYISSDDNSTVFYRLPSSNIFTIHNVTMRRVSYHDSLFSNWEGFQLKIVEIKALYTKTHHDDRKLYQSFERSYYEMIDDGRIHYEVAIVHEGINMALKSNHNLELGELTPAETTGKNLLNQEVIRSMLDLTAATVERMDWLGMDNYGTINRKADEAARRHEQWSNILPPTALDTISERQLHIPVGYDSLGTDSNLRGGSFSGHGGGTMTRVSGAPIHGVRAGTQAEVYRDMDGNYYRYGQGGARIPVVIANDTNTPMRSDIVPGDSASQIGGSRIVLQRTERNARNDIGSKPPGFW